MAIASLVSKRGTCLRAQVGAVIACDGRVLVTGYNGPPANLPHCADGCKPIPISGCIRAVHAEANCIAYAARHGIATNGTDLYCSHLPCLKCAELIINAGIIRVFFHEDYRLKDGEELLRSAGVDIIQL
jgi:dCMP deaminase